MFLRRLARTLCVTVSVLLGSQVVSLAAICEPNFAHMVCVADHAYERQCTPLPDSYQDYRIEEQLYELFELSPRMVQLGFCAVDQIRIVKNWGTLANGGFVKGSRIFVDRDFLFQIALLEPDEAYHRSTYHFPQGTDAEPLTLVDHHHVEKRLKRSFGPEFAVRYEFANFFLHELAHVIDLNWEMNKHAGIGYFGCFLAKQVLGAKNDNMKWRYSSVFPAQFPEGLTSDLYGKLQSSEFASFYGMSSSREDFAELFADYVLLKFFGIDYTIEKSGETLFDRGKQFDSSDIQHKIKIVQSVLDWPHASEQERIKLANEQAACRDMFEPS